MIDNIPNTEIVTSMEDKAKVLKTNIGICKKQIEEYNTALSKKAEIIKSKQEQMKVLQAEIDNVKQECLTIADDRKAQDMKVNRMSKEYSLIKEKITQANDLRSKVKNFVSNLSQEEMDAFFVELLGDAQEKSPSHVYLLDRREKMSAEEEAFFSYDDEDDDIPLTGDESDEAPFARQEGEAFSFRS